MFQQLVSTLFLGLILGSATVDAQRSNCPTPSLRRRQQADAEFTIDRDTLTSQLFCVGGVENALNPFLLVPGTGNNGTQSWEHGYVKLLGKDGGLGYDVCYVSPPPFMLDDIQNNAEYIANAIDMLYNVNCRPFPIMGWSQGNLATQWTLTFFPTTRRKITQFLSLAGDFRGTGEGIIVEAAQTLGGSARSVIQQSIPSNFLAALAAKGGNYNWVPTTSIASATDEVVQPQLASTMAGSTSFIGGSRTGNIFIQDFCPISVGHGEQLYVNFSYQVVKLALASPTRFASQARVRTAVADGTIPCIQDDVAPRLSQADVSFLQDSFLFAGAVVIAPPPQVAQVNEPPVRDYVERFPDNRIHD